METLGGFPTPPATGSGEQSSPSPPRSSVVAAARPPKLGAALLASGHTFPPELAIPALRLQALPEKVLQFGEGNFLRAFVDWMFARLNRRGAFDGRVVAVQPIAAGLARQINAQDGLYTVILRGLQGGRIVEQREILSAVSRCVDPYQDFEAFIACAANPDLRYVVSNTTEAGIKTDPADAPDARPCPSFPGKLTQLLHARFRQFGGAADRGLVMLPCELIERNGDALARAVAETADSWKLGDDFRRWLDDACLFTNTLVDRIVTGYPKDEAADLGAQLGYQDDLLVTGEIFHSWVIESRRPLEAELPFVAAGLDVTWAADVGPYRERKVRILNGAHAMMVLAAYLAGKETVRECMDDPLFRSFMRVGIEREILPTLTLPRADLETFANSVTERFSNPFIKHYLLSIALNSVSKYKARILGTVLDYRRTQGHLPPRLTFALAALIAFYRGSEIRDGALIGRRDGAEYRIQDDAAVLAAFRDAWEAAGDRPSGAACLTLVRRLLARADFWGQDLTVALPGFDVAVAQHLTDIVTDGIRAALERVA
jgi:tagaturonate reductase